MKDIEQMIGSKPGRFWAVVWKFVTPALIMVKRATYKNSIVSPTPPGDDLFPN